MLGICTVDPTPHVECQGEKWKPKDKSIRLFSLSYECSGSMTGLFHAELKLKPQVTNNHSPQELGRRDLAPQLVHCTCLEVRCYCITMR